MARRRARLIALALGAALVVLVAGCGGSSHGASTHAASASSAARRAAARHRASRPVAVDVRVRYHPLYTLPAPLRDPAFAPLGPARFVMLGGLDSADVSSAGIEVADLHGVLHTAALPGPQHDAQAAALGAMVYVFGGGDTTELSHILRYDPATGAVAPAGALLAPQSDVAVTRYGATAYVVGGFDGTNYLNTVVAWRPGTTPQVQARLPVGLRYAAVTVAGSDILIIGGSTPAGASDGIYRFNPATHAVARIGTLRHPITHANAATLGSTVYLVGGRGDTVDAQTSDIWAIDPRTGRVRAAGHLPAPASDAAVLTMGRGIVVAGGQSPSGTLAGVGELLPVAAG